jgi:hypothetical protein
MHKVGLLDRDGRLTFLSQLAYYVGFPRVSFLLHRKLYIVIPERLYTSHHKRPPSSPNHARSGDTVAIMCGCAASYRAETISGPWA